MEREGRKVKRWLIRFSGDEGIESTRARRSGQMQRVFMSRTYEESYYRLPPTSTLVSLLPSSFPGWLQGARDEANQGIMEELHTCAASSMLYYINREYTVGPTLPVYIIAGVRRGEGAGSRRKDRGRKRETTGERMRTREQTHVRASVVECSKESQRAHPASASRDATRG